MSNSNYFKQIRKSYKSWMEINDCQWKMFDKFCNNLEKYSDACILNEMNKSRIISDRFIDVYRNCNSINFDIDGVSQAYILFHLLERYHRYQELFADMIEQAIMPIRTNPIDIVDIGTGPGPFLYAISDTYDSLLKYAYRKK
jgi:ribosomal protein RSM22 (predicted rRNA methylase)